MSFCLVNFHLVQLCKYIFDSVIFIVHLANFETELSGDSPLSSRTVAVCETGDRLALVESLGRE